LDGFFDGGAWGEDGFDSSLFEGRDIFFRDDASTEDDDIFCSFFFEPSDDFREDVVVGSGEDGQSDGIDILLDGGVDDLFWGLVQARVDDFEACVPEPSGDDFGSPVVSIESRFSDEDSDSSFGAHSSSPSLLGFKEFLFISRAFTPLEVSWVGVSSEDLSPDVADLLDSGVFSDGVDEVGHEVFSAQGGLSDLFEALFDFLVVSSLFDFSKPSELSFFDFRFHPPDGDGWMVGDVFIDSHDDLLSGVDLFLESVGRLCDLHLGVASFDGLDHPSHLIDLSDVLPGLLFDLVGEGFDKVGAGEGVDGIRDSGLFGEDLLGSEGDGDGLFSGDGVGFVEGVGVKGLGSSQDSGQGLVGCSYDVIVGLLCGEGASCGLGMEAEHPGSGVFGHEAFSHDLCPHPSGGSKLSDLFEEVDMGVEEEGESWGELIDIEASLHGGFHIGDPIGQGEGQFLDGRGSSLPDVVAADADRVPARDLSGAVFDRIDDDSKRRSGREHEGLLGDKLFEHVVLDSPSDLLLAYPLFFGHYDVHSEKDGGWRVDGHGGGDSVQRDSFEEDLHIL